MKKFKKAPGYMGKSLSLFVGGGDRRISDLDILEGAFWEKFVGLGYLVPVESGVVEPQKVNVVPVIKKVVQETSAKKVSKPKPEPKPESKPEPEPEPEPKPEPKPDVVPNREGVLTKSTAEKMAKAMGKKGKTSTRRRKSSTRSKD